MGPARDKRYMAMHGKENKHNQADMHGARCKEVQSPFRWLRHSLHTSIPVSYGNISVRPARDKRYMAMHGKENNNQADMHGTMCKKVQSPFSPLITISCQNCP